MSFFMSDPHVAARGGLSADVEGHIFKWNEIDLREAVQSHGQTDKTFWDNTYQAVVDGKSVILKTYPSQSVKDFRRDLEIMKMHRHNNLPFLFGRSPENATTPFIALSMGSFVPFRDYLGILGQSSSPSALGEAWKMLISLRYTSEYLVQQNICETHFSLERTLEGAVVGESGKIMLAPSFPQSSFDSDVGAPQRPLYLEDIPKEIASSYRTLLAFGFDAASTTSPGPDSTGLRSLSYALKENPSESLHSSFTRTADSDTLRFALARWRPLATSETRRIELSPDIYINHDIEKQGTVGDVGTFLKGQDGDPTFVPLTNVQKELGGFILVCGGDNAERVSHDNWRFSSAISSSGIVAANWNTYTPAEVALDFLSINAKRLAERYGVRPESLALVTDVALNISFLKTSQGGHPFVFLPFDRQGRIDFPYWSTSPIDKQDTAAFEGVSATKASFSGWPKWRYVQIEEDELRGGDTINSPSPFYISACLGDIGRFERNMEGERKFYAVANVTAGLRIKYQAWETNDCEQICDGVWRSPLIKFQECGFVRYSWKVDLYSDLPPDVEPFYWYHCLARSGPKAMGASEDTYHVVQSLSHQVFASGCVLHQDSPLHLFVHFSDLGHPIQAYLSKSDTPENPAIQPTFCGSCDVSMSHGVASRLSQEVRLLRNVRRLTHDVGTWDPLQAQAETKFTQHQLGDVGYWKRDPKNPASSEWVLLQRTEVPQTQTHSQHFASPGYAPCTRISERLWKSDYLKTWSAPYSVEYTWEEDYLGTPPTINQRVCMETAAEAGLSLEDLSIVTKITTKVRAITLEGATNYVRYFGEQGFGKDFGEAHLYVLFTPQGGCLAYWSSYRHTEINLDALSKLDLEAFQTVSGCEARVSFELVRTSLGSQQPLVV